MKKRTLRLIALLSACVVFGGCGGEKASSPAPVPVRNQTAESGSAEQTKPATEIKGDLGSLNASDYVKLGQYKGLEATVPDTTVSAEDVNRRIESDLESIAYMESVEGRPVQDGDIANIDYVGKKDGEAFQGGTAEGYNLEIGSHTFIEGFEEGLIGTNVGEKRVLHLKFPEEYHSEELAGQEVTFDVTVNSISRNVIPQLNDASVKELNPDISTVEEYRKAIENELKEDKAESAKAAVRVELMARVRGDAEIVSGDKLPSWLIEQDVQMQKDNLEGTLMMYGASLDEYLAEIGKSEEEFDAELTEYAESLAQQQLLIEAIFQAEGLSITNEDIKKAYDEQAKEYGYDSGDEFKKTLQERGEEKTFVNTIKGDMVAEILLDNAKLTNPEMKNW